MPGAGTGKRYRTDLYVSVVYFDLTSELRRMLKVYEKESTYQISMFRYDTRDYSPRPRRVREPPRRAAVTCMVT